MKVQLFIINNIVRVGYYRNKILPTIGEVLELPAGGAFLTITIGDKVIQEWLESDYLNGWFLNKLSNCREWVDISIEIL